MREYRATGREAMLLASELLQRARLADPDQGIWEAADVQWWWRRPRRSQELEQSFWVDEQGPVAGVLMTSWRDDRWQCDPVLIPAAGRLDPELVWARAMDDIASYATGSIEVNLRDDDPTFTELVAKSDLAAAEQWTTAWMSVPDRPEVRPVADGFTVVDRTQRQGAPHPMRGRNGPAVAERLAECPLYDPELDLAVESVDGRTVGYSLYWFDPTTRVGLVEPVRVEDEFQRRGIASAMLTEGIDRLADKGAERVKIGFGTEAASAVYQGVGFRPTATVTIYEAAV